MIDEFDDIDNNNDCDSLKFKIGIIAVVLILIIFSYPIITRGNNNQLNNEMMLNDENLYIVVEKLSEIHYDKNAFSPEVYTYYYFTIKQSNTGKKEIVSVNRNDYMYYQVEDIIDKYKIYKYVNMNNAFK